MIQDLKVGHLLGGTPRAMEIAEIIGVVASALLMTFPMVILHRADILRGGIGIGGAELPAPQAGLMALLSRGIVGGEMAWPLIVFGMAFAVMLLLINAPSPMLIAVGMYLPLQTTFAIFVGGVIRWIYDRRASRIEGLSEEARYRGENTGTLVASGLIAGEALMGVLLALLVIFEMSPPQVLAEASGWPGLLVFAILGWILVKFPLEQARAKS
jgi:putative OPT family oligopeptide transporter